MHTTHFFESRKYYKQVKTTKRKEKICRNRQKYLPSAELTGEGEDKEEGADGEIDEVAEAEEGNVEDVLEDGIVGIDVVVRVELELE